MKSLQRIAISAFLDNSADHWQSRPIGWVRRRKLALLARRSRSSHQQLTTAHCRISLISRGPAFWAHASAQTLAFCGSPGLRASFE